MRKSRLRDVSVFSVPSVCSVVKSESANTEGTEAKEFAEITEGFTLPNCGRVSALKFKSTTSVAPPACRLRKEPNPDRLKPVPLEPLLGVELLHDFQGFGHVLVGRELVFGGGKDRGDLVVLADDVGNPLDEVVVNRNATDVHRAGF